MIDCHRRLPFEATPTGCCLRRARRSGCGAVRTQLRLWLRRPRVPGDRAFAERRLSVLLVHSVQVVGHLLSGRGVPAPSGGGHARRRHGARHGDSARRGRRDRLRHARAIFFAGRRGRSGARRPGRALHGTELPSTGRVRLSVGADGVRGRHDSQRRRAARALVGRGALARRRDGVQERGGVLCRRTSRMGRLPVPRWRTRPRPIGPAGCAGRGRVRLGGWRAGGVLRGDRPPAAVRRVVVHLPVLSLPAADRVSSEALYQTPVGVAARWRRPGHVAAKHHAAVAVRRRADLAAAGIGLVGPCRAPQTAGEPLRVSRRGVPLDLCRRRLRPSGGRSVRGQSGHDGPTRRSGRGSLSGQRVAVSSGGARPPLYGAVVRGRNGMAIPAPVARPRGPACDLLQRAPEAVLARRSISRLASAEHRRPDDLVSGAPRSRSAARLRRSAARRRGVRPGLDRLRRSGFSPHAYCAGVPQGPSPSP